MYNAIELGGALLISFIINLFVVAAFANGEPVENLTLETAYVSRESEEPPGAARG